MRVLNKITLTGDLGSGKSAASRLLCAATGYAYLSTGQIQRRLAAELGIDTLEMNRRADTDPTIDQRIDGVFVALNDDPAGYVVDSRMAWFFIPHSFKIYLQVDARVAAERILSDPTRNSEQYASVDEAIEKIRARKASENVRFLTKYGADCADLHNFDVVINTTRRTPNEVNDLIGKALEAHRAGVPFPRFWS
jgi:CMP/dCMP kinase